MIFLVDFFGCFDADTESAIVFPPSSLFLVSTSFLRVLMILLFNDDASLKITSPPLLTSEISSE